MRPARYCLRGHDTWECGRSPTSRVCMVCRRDMLRRSRKNRYQANREAECERSRRLYAANRERYLKTDALYNERAKAAFGPSRIMQFWGRQARNSQ